MKPARTAFLFALALGWAVPSQVAAQPQLAAHRPCAAEANRHFDFWEGRWMVRAANGALAGHNTIRPILGDCVLHEHYTTPSGYEGESLNVYDAARGVWHQTWTDNRGLLLLLEGGYEGSPLSRYCESQELGAELWEHPPNFGANREIDLIHRVVDNEGELVLAPIE